MALLPDPTTAASEHPGFCAGGFSRPNGSGYPLSVPARGPPPPPHFKVLGGGKGEVKQVSNTPPRVGGYMYVFMYITYICVCMYVSIVIPAQVGALFQVYLTYV